MGKIIRNDWKDYGRNGCLNDNDLGDLETKMNIKSGSTIAEDEIKNAIQEKQRLAIERIRRVPITKMDTNPSPKTIRKYLAMMANQEGVSIYTSAFPKITRRHTAKNSLILSMTLLCVITSTRYDISTEFQRDEEKDICNSSKGVSFFHNVITQLYDNLPIHVVRSELLVSTDDTINYIYEGKGKEKMHID